MADVVGGSEAFFLQGGQANIGERARAAGFGGLDARGIAAPKVLVHFFGNTSDKFAQFGAERHFYAPFCLAVKNIADGDFGREHFFKANCLGAELGFVTFVAFFFAMLIFNGDGLPKSISLWQADAPLSLRERGWG